MTFWVHFIKKAVKILDFCVFSKVYGSGNIYWVSSDNEWILLNGEMMPKILGYLLMLKFLLSDIRFLALFRHLEESTQFG